MQCQMIEHYPINLPSGDLILCDEESLLQEPPPSFFVFGDYIIRGIALVVGDNPPEYADVKMSLEAVKKLLQFQPETNDGVVIYIVD
jgi:hypothetical protein